MRLRGGGTHQRFGNLAAETGVSVDLTNLNEIIEHSTVDLTLAVGAGTKLSTIDELLTWNGQRLALDMPHRDRATIGGAFATGLSGPRRLRYGSLKDMVIGSEVVNFRGEVTKSGGMVVKNVSGYELSRLHYGAQGAFGVVSRLNLKVLPAPESRVEVEIGYGDVSRCLKAAERVLVSSLDPAAVYAVRSEGLWTLNVQLEGSERFTAGQSERVIAAISDIEQPDSADVSTIAGQSTPAFDAVADLSAVDDTFVVRFSVPASRQASTLEAMALEESCQVLADQGSGLIYARCPASDLETLDWLRQVNEPHTILSMPDELKDGIDVFGQVGRAEATLLSRLKDEYDPQRIFNPGRFVSFL